MSEQPAIRYAELLRQLRAEEGLTQEELASAAGLSPRTVSDLERGINQTPRKATAELLADALRLTAPKREQFMAAARRRPAARPKATPGAGPTQEVAPIEAIAPVDAIGPADTLGPADSDGYDASNAVWIESAASAAFVDREEELGVLREAWSSAREGHRVLTLIAGEPGIGKTALTAELARRVRADGGLVLYGRWDEHVPAPYQAFREALNDYARACPDAVLRRELAGLAEEIARLCPEPARRVGAFAPPLAAAEAERFRLFESLDAWIRRIAGRRPVLLVLDDLQWADQPSLFLLPHLMRAQRSTPLLIVAMYRDVGPERSEFAAALPSLARDIDCRRVSLRGLEHHAVTALLEDAVGRPFGERESVMVTELEWETAGNPFFLLEMARHLSEVGAFDRDVVRLGETPAEIPQSVRDMVRSRLRRLSDDCVDTLAVAALIGERFDGALLATAAGLTDAATIDLLEEAARAGLIAESDDEPDHWRFSHSLTRRVTSEELGRSRRAALHQRIGETLEFRPGVSAAELAHHFGAAANQRRRAARRCDTGGWRGSARCARWRPRSPCGTSGRRSSCSTGSAPRTRRSAASCSLTWRTRTTGPVSTRPGTSGSPRRRTTARRLPAGRLFARAALGYGGVLPSWVRPDRRAQALLEEALERLDEKDDAIRATVLARLAHWLHTVRPYPERLALSDRSVAMARAAADRRTLATVLLHRCWALDGPDDVGDALTVADEILDIGAELGDPALTLEGLRIRLTAQFEHGGHSAAVQTAGQMKTLAETVRHPEFIRLAAMWDIVLATIEGRFKEAEEQAGELGRRLDRIGHSQAQLISVAQSASWGLLQGRAAEYIAPFEAMSIAEPANLAWPAITAWYLAEAGARDRAAELLRRTDPAAVADADKNYLWWAVVVGFSGAVDLVGDRRWAQALYDLAAPYAGRNCTLGLASFLGAADHWLGVLAGAAGRYAEASGHLEAALERHREMGARSWTAFTEEAYGRVLSLRGQPGDAERAAALTESAMRSADELGLAAVTGRLRRQG